MIITVSTAYFIFTMILVGFNTYFGLYDQPFSWLYWFNVGFLTIIGIGFPVKWIREDN